MTIKTTITVDGCDDLTRIEFEFADTAEYLLVDSIAKAITAASICSCMPRMTIELQPVESTDHD